MSKYEWQAHAQHFRDQCLLLIGVEEKVVRAEHDLLTQISSLEPVLAHVDELLPAKHPYHELSQNACLVLLEVRGLLEEDELANVHIVAEERTALKQLDEDCAHSNWRVVKHELKSDRRKTKRKVKIELKHLSKLQKLFDSLAKSLLRLHSLATPRANTPASSAQQYLMHIYQLAVFYVDFFKKIALKERILEKKIRSA